MKPNECRKCGARIPRIIIDRGFAFRCNRCGSQTKLKKSFDEAVNAWNEGDFEWVEVDHAVKELVGENNGHCPCAIWQSDDTLCPCKEFREQESGLCNCGRFEKAQGTK